MEMGQKDSGVSGGVLMVLAMVVLPVSDALSKYLVQNYSSEQITLMRNLVHGGVGLLFLAIGGRLAELRVKNPIGHALRAVFFVTMTASFVAALRFMPLADALGIVFVFPMLILLLSALWLKEPANGWQWLAVIGGFAGVLLIVRPGGGVVPGAWLALVAAVATAFYNLLTRRLAGTGSPFALLVVPALFGTTLLTPFTIPKWQMPGLADLSLMVLVGLLAALVHGLIILAYLRSSAGRIAPLAYVQIAMAVVMGLLLFGDWPDRQSWAGLTIVVGSGLIVLFQSRKANA